MAAPPTPRRRAPLVAPARVATAGDAPPGADADAGAPPVAPAVPEGATARVDGPAAPVVSEGATARVDGSDGPAAPAGAGGATDRVDGSAAPAGAEGAAARLDGSDGPTASAGQEGTTPRAGGAGGPAEPAPRRGTAAAVAVGAGTAIATAGLLYGLCAGPIYVLAQIATDGLDRPAFRTALVVALVASVVLGAVAGAATGTWYARGGRLPTDRRSILDR